MKNLTMILALFATDSVAEEPGRYEIILLKGAIIATDTQTGMVKGCKKRSPDWQMTCSVLIEAADPEGAIPNRFHLLLNPDEKSHVFWIVDTSEGHFRFCTETGSLPFKCGSVD